MPEQLTQPSVFGQPLVRRQLTPRRHATSDNGADCRIELRLGKPQTLQLPVQSNLLQCRQDSMFDANAARAQHF